MESLFTSATVPKRPVLYAQLAVILEEHHALAWGEVAFAAFDADGAVIRRQLACDLDPGLLAQFCASRGLPAHCKFNSRTSALVCARMSAFPAFFTPWAAWYFDHSLINSSFALLRPSAK